MQRANGKAAGSGTSAASRPKPAREFPDGAIVRIAGHPHSSKLNGCLARVQRFNAEDGCYTVSMLSGGTMDSLERAYLNALPMKDEVEAGLEELERSELTSEAAITVVLRLRDLPIDARVLKETQVGKILNHLTKPGGKLGNNEVFVNIARSLVKKWRMQFQKTREQELTKNESASTEPMTSGCSSSSFSSGVARVVTKSQVPYVAVPNKEEGSSERFFTADVTKCMARIWNNGAGGQCSRKQAGPSKRQDLCASHQALLDRNGQLPHGRVDGDIPEHKQVEYKDTQLKTTVLDLLGNGDSKLELSSSNETFQSIRNKRLDLPEMPPINSDADVQKLVTYMKNAPNDRVRMATLLALDRTCCHQAHLLPSFISHGGLSALEKWIREYVQCRYACLTLLMQLPLTEEDVALVKPAVKTAATDTRPEIQTKIVPVLDYLRNPKPQAPTKRPQSNSLESTSESKRTKILSKSTPLSSGPPVKQAPIATVRPRVDPTPVRKVERPQIQQQSVATSPAAPPQQTHSSFMAVAPKERVVTASSAVPTLASTRPEAPVPPPQQTHSSFMVVAPKEAVVIGNSAVPTLSSSPEAPPAPPPQQTQSSFMAVAPMEGVVAANSVLPPVVSTSPQALPARIQHEIVDVPDLPPEIRRLDPKIQAVFLAKPKLIKLMQKHPEVISNFHAGSIKRLGSLLKSAQESEILQQELDEDNVRSVSDVEAAACRTIIISKLPPDTIVSDIEALFDNFGPVEIALPRESRRKTHVGIAHVTLVDAKTAVEAIQAINGCDFYAARDPEGIVIQICAALAVQANGVSRAAPERVSWRASDELWEQRMFNPDASVTESCNTKMMVEMLPTSEAARAEFRDAARKEREEQAKLAKLMSENAIVV